MKKFYTFIAVACVAMTASAASFEKSSKTIDATRTVNTTIENVQPVAKLPEGIIKGLRTRADELPDVTGTYVLSGDYCMEQGGTPRLSVISSNLSREVQVVLPVAIISLQGLWVPNRK